jgi:hypothetical protein
MREEHHSFLRRKKISIMVLHFILATCWLLLISAAAGEQNGWPTLTDDSSSPAFYRVNVRMMVDDWPLADNCYTSIYQYSRDAQKEFAGAWTGSWGGSEFVTETQQFVFSGLEGSVLSDFDYRLFVQVDPKNIGDIKKLQISHLGNTADSEFTTVEVMSLDQLWGDGAGGFEIPFSKIVKSWKPKAGTYERNPLHISILPMSGDDEFLAGYPALAVFVGGTAVPATDCNNIGSKWCNPTDSKELCCYLKADPDMYPSRTLPMDWKPDAAYIDAVGKYSGRNGNDAFACFTDENTMIQGPYVTADNGVWVSSLNNLLKSTQAQGAYAGMSIRIVVDPTTTVNFPLSNFFCSDAKNLECGYDVGGSRVTIEGYGRINGYAAQQGFNGDFNGEYKVKSSLVWLTGDGSQSSGNGWNAFNDVGFTWANGDSPGAAHNDGSIESRYGIVVKHIQVGYGPTRTDAPVSLGDFQGVAAGPVSNEDSYGASVLAKDVKFVSYSGGSDGISLRNPASFGSGLFIHGSDDLLKSMTSFDSIGGWVAQAITFWAGFDYYGSLSCPCCFGPGSSWSTNSVHECASISVQDVIVPVVHAEYYADDCAAAGYSCTGRGLISTKWALDIGDGIVPPIGKENMIKVDNIEYSRWKILENGWNDYNVPLVNWLMNSPPEQDGQTYYSLASPNAVVFNQVYSLVFSDAYNGFFEYNYGIDESAAVVDITNGGQIKAYGISAKLSPSPCSDDDFNPTILWGVCPTGFNGLLPKDCWAWDTSVGGSQETFEEACGAKGVSADRPSASIYGQNCQGDPYGFCGLSFNYS